MSNENDTVSKTLPAENEKHFSSDILLSNIPESKFTFSPFLLKAFKQAKLDCDEKAMVACLYTSNIFESNSIPEHIIRPQFEELLSLQDVGKPSGKEPTLQLLGKRLFKRMRRRQEIANAITEAEEQNLYEINESFTEESLADFIEKKHH